MNRTVWIPEWLYRWLPRGAMVAGGMGVYASSAQFMLLLVSMATMAYGIYVLLRRLDAAMPWS